MKNKLRSFMVLAALAVCFGTFSVTAYPDGEILAFLECQPERIRAKDREAEKTSDTVKAPEHREEKRSQKPPSLREQLRRAQEARPLPGAGVPERER